MQNSAQQNCKSELKDQTILLSKKTTLWVYWHFSTWRKYKRKRKHWPQHNIEDSDRRFSSVNYNGLLKEEKMREVGPSGWTSQVAQ